MLNLKNLCSSASLLMLRSYFVGGKPGQEEVPLAKPWRTPAAPCDFAGPEVQVYLFTMRLTGVEDWTLHHQI
jgi:hypothetical protein